MPEVIVPLALLDAFVIACALTLMALATLVMFRPIILFFANLLSNIPGIGSTLADALNDLSSSISNFISEAVSNAYQAGAKPLVDGMNTFANPQSGALYQQAQVNSRIVGAILYTAEQSLGHVTSPTQTYVTNTSQANNTYITNNYQTDITQSYTYTEASYGQLADWANNAVQSVYHDIVDADGRVGTLATTVAADAMQAKDYTDTLTATAETNAINIAGDYTLRSFQTGEDYTTKVRDYATAINADTRTWAEGEITTKTTQVADALDSKIAIVATVAAAAETAFADFMNDCGGTLCGDGLPIIKALKAAENLFTTGAIIAFLTAAIADPVDTGNATAEVIDAVTEPVKTIASSVFGV